MRSTYANLWCGYNFVTAETLSKLLSVLNVKAVDMFDFEHNKNEESLKNELVSAIINSKTDIKMLYKFYKSIN